MSDQETHAKWGDGYRDMLYTFADAGLAAPPVPKQLRTELEQIDPWCWSSRDIDPMSMYMFDEYITELGAREIADYVAISHAGHGSNSYGLNYHLVSGRAAVFTQDGWGGDYMDAIKARAEVASTFSQIYQFLGAIASVDESSPRVVLKWSSFRGVRTAGLQSSSGHPVEMLDVDDQAELFARGTSWAELPAKEQTADWLAHRCKFVPEARHAALHGRDSLARTEPAPSDGLVAATEWRAKFLDAFISEMQRFNREMNG